MFLQALCGGPGAPAVPASCVVVAHPDDETVGAASRLPRLKHAHFVYVTDGAPLDGHDAGRHGLDVDGYRALRARERDAALASSGIDSRHVIDLGHADQQAARHLPALAMRLADLFLTLRPDAVLTHPYEGGHPDHDATAFGVHAAAALLRQRGEHPPSLLEMTSYHQGPHGLQSGEFLPDPGADAGQESVLLDATEQMRKRALLACYASQRETLAQFGVAVERFRPAPRYDFARAPHGGPLYYETHPWGWTGADFRALAVAALADLRLEGPL